MDYNEQQALDIIQRFGLNESTNAVWRSRGKIPDKYFREGFQIKEKASGEKDMQAIRDIRRIFGYGKLNSASIARLLDIKPSRMMDIIFNDITPTKDEILAIKKVINTIRLESRVVLSEFSKNAISGISLSKLKFFLGRDEIKLFAFFENRETAKKFFDWINDARQFPDGEESAVIQSLMVFSTELVLL